MNNHNSFIDRNLPSRDPGLSNYFSSKAQCEQWNSRHMRPVSLPSQTYDFLGSPMHSADGNQQRNLEDKLVEFKNDNRELVRNLDEMDDEQNELLNDLNVMADENEDLVEQVKGFRSHNKVLLEEIELATKTRNFALDELEKVEDDFMAFRATVLRSKEILKKKYPSLVADLDLTILLDLPVKHQKSEKASQMYQMWLYQQELQSRASKVSRMNEERIRRNKMKLAAEKSEKGGDTDQSRSPRRSPSTGFLSSFIARIKAEGELEMIGSEHELLAIQAAAQATNDARALKEEQEKLPKLQEERRKSLSQRSPSFKAQQALSNQKQNRRMLARPRSRSPPPARARGGGRSLSPFRRNRPNQGTPLVKVPSTQLELDHDVCAASCIYDSDADSNKKNISCSPTKKAAVARALDLNDLKSLLLPREPPLSTDSKKTTEAEKEQSDSPFSSDHGSNASIQSPQSPLMSRPLSAFMPPIFGTGGGRGGNTGMWG